MSTKNSSARQMSVIMIGNDVTVVVVVVVDADVSDDDTDDEWTFNVESAGIEIKTIRNQVTLFLVFCFNQIIIIHYDPKLIILRVTRIC